ncbi:MAG: 30S ribosome-binding factor RbfA [Flavobacteriales bacterium Tduv]
METIRQKKIATLLRKELANMLRREASYEQNGLLISVTQVHVTADLGLARVFISLFPSEEKHDIFEVLRSLSGYYKKKLAEKLRNQLRKLPELDFRLDNSLDYADQIEKELRGEGENPIK